MRYPERVPSTPFRRIAFCKELIVAGDLGAFMSYSLTERKRIRKSFAKRANVQPVPFLLATQLESYTAFLQAHVAPESRRNEGLQAAFTSIFPISSHSGNARLEFVSFQLGEPP